MASFRRWVGASDTDIQTTRHSKARRSAVRGGASYFSGLTHCPILVYLSYQDDPFRSGSPFLSLTTKSSANAILLSSYGILALDVVSVLLDIVLAFVNKRNLRR